MTDKLASPVAPSMIAHLSRAFTAIPFNRMLGLRLDHLDAEHVLMSFDMKNELIGNFLHGILHGGVTSSVLDMAGGMVVMTTAITEHPHATPEELAKILGKCSTIDLQISYLRPGKGERFSAKAWIIKQGHKICFTRMELHNHTGSLIASGNGTYLIS
ncbi:MAG: hypothetical protein A3E85_03910 [Gammaproteobacteria bacterium RIFCSPHIGHO2_12_FULL_45_12]|nr:MAG: hypothetical protein A3E85_03910 [Gammaproteobacteria bacterium RIFCSPHIGHO2_12_FULL_45_12]